MTFLSIDTRDDLPKVSYLTALDYFVMINYAFILATVLEFASVHYFTKLGSGEEFPSDSEEDIQEDVFEEEIVEDLPPPDCPEQQVTLSGITLCMRLANERRRYNVASSPIGWPHTQNDPGIMHILHVKCGEISHDLHG